MKRYISLVLVSVVLLCSLSVPAFASEFGLDSNFNSLDLMQFLDLGKVYTHTGSNIVTVELPLDRVVYGIDFMVDDQTGINSVSITVDGTNYTFQRRQLGNGIKRFFLDEALPVDSLILNFNCNNTGEGWFNFLSFFVDYSQKIFYDTYSQALGYGPNDVRIDLHSNDRPGIVYQADIDNSGFSFDLYCPEWRFYDFIDFSFIGQGIKITSMSCNVSGVDVPIQYSFLDSYAYPDVPLAVTVRIDVRGLDRNAAAAPCVVVTGDSALSTMCGISLTNCVGSVAVNDVNPFFIYFRDLGKKIEIGTQRIIDSITGGSSDQVDQVVNDFKDQASNVQQNNDALQQLQKPVIDPNTSDISGIVSPSNTVKYTLFLTRIMNAPILADVIMLAMIFSLAAYVLFGKR